MLRKDDAIATAQQMQKHVDELHELNTAMSAERDAVVNAYKQRQAVILRNITAADEALKDFKNEYREYFPQQVIGGGRPA